MTPRYIAAMNGQSLTNTVPGAYLADITEHWPEMVRHVELLAGGSSYTSNALRKSLSVSLAVVLPGSDVVIRQQMADQLTAWCQQGRLTISTRPGWFLDVVCTKPPKITSFQNWETPLLITFTAYEIPFWQCEQVLSVALHGSVDETTCMVPGTAAVTTVDAVITNPSDTVCRLLVLTCGATQLMFDGINLLRGETLHITHAENGRLKMMIHRAGGTEQSAFPYRLAASDNDLQAVCGMVNRLNLTADAAVQAEIQIQGRVA